MGYTVRLQKVERPTNRSYYINLPVVLAETLGLEKGEILEWIIKDQENLLLHRKGEKEKTYKNKSKIAKKK